MTDKKEAFDAPPRDDEVDQKIAADPWILRKRLTMAAYTARCALAGREPEIGEWMDHLRLIPEELQLLNDMIDEMRGYHFIDEFGPKFRIREYGNKPRVAWYDKEGLLQTQSHGEFVRGHREKKIEIEVEGKDTPKKISLAEHWLDHPLTRIWNTVDFQPGVKQDDMSADVLNLWRGWPARLQRYIGWDDTRIGEDGLEPVRDGIFDGAEMPKGHCDMFMMHMRYNMCDGDDLVFKYLLGWMADAIWNPGPCDIAIILQGAQGAGKTFWAEQFMEMFGIYAQTFTDDQEVLGHFNKHLEYLMIVFADEAFFAGSAANAAKLKTFTSKKDIRIEPKGVDSYRMPKKFRLIMASNNAHIIRAEIDDRRNFVLAVDAGEHNQDHEHFKAMEDELDQGGLEALFRWLTGAYWGDQVSDGKFKMWDRPITRALDEQKGMSLSPEQMAIENMLRAGEPPCDFICDDDGMFVPVGLMMAAAKLKVTQENAFTKALKAVSGDNKKKATHKRFLIEGKSRPQRGRAMPDLAEARSNWEDYIGREVNWPRDVVGWVGEDPAQEDEIPF